MPVLKQIAGHGSCAALRRYLEKDGRALGRDLFGFAEVTDASLLGEPGADEGFNWAKAMDDFRAANGNDAPWKGRAARTFKHFVLSPAPEDGVDLQTLRELTHAWVGEFFDDFQVAVVYHDDNGSRIPHAHVVVNNTSVSTGRRMHHDDPRDLNRGLQEMARARGLRFLSDEGARPRTGFERLSARDAGPQPRARTLQESYRSRAERRAEEEQGYSWVGDIRSRVSVAKNLARSEAEFRRILSVMGIEVADSSSRSRRPDWVFSLAEAPTRRVSGERLGAAFGKDALGRRFRAGAGLLADMPSRELLAIARGAVELGDLGQLRALADALETCDRWRVSSAEEASAAIGILRGRLARAGSEADADRMEEDVARLERARDFLGARGILAPHAPRQADGGGARGESWADEPTAGGLGPAERGREPDSRGGRQR